MRKTTAAVLALSALALTACATGRGNEPVVATLNEAGGDIVLRPGQTLHAYIYLEEGTGLVWRIDKATRLRTVGYQGRMVGREGRPLPAIVRHNGLVQQFQFEATGRGEGELVFTLAPSRDPGAAPEGVTAYRIHVK